jgi:hypothetical protein
VTASVPILGPAAALAVAVGATLAWKPVLVLALGLAVCCCGASRRPSG